MHIDKVTSKILSKLSAEQVFVLVTLAIVCATLVKLAG
jgi:hypothetical protein